MGKAAGKTVSGKRDKSVKKRREGKERKEVKKRSSQTSLESAQRSRAFKVLNELLDKKYIAELAMTTLTSRSKFREGSVYHFAFSHNDPDPRSLSFLDFHPADVAHVLSCDQHSRFARIPLAAFERKGHGKSAEDVTQFGDHTSRLSLWVGTEIVMIENMRQRVVAIRRFVNVAEELLAMNNYNTLLAVLTGLKCVKRMRECWKAAGRKTIQTFGEMCALFEANNNFGRYREIRRNLDPPCLPYVGLDLQDLTFIESGNGDFMDPPVEAEGKFVNYQKMKLVGDILGKIRRSQLTKYPPLSPPAPALQYYLTEHLPTIPEKEIRRRAGAFC